MRSTCDGSPRYLSGQAGQQLKLEESGLDNKEEVSGFYPAAQGCLRAGAAIIPILEGGLDDVNSIFISPDARIPKLICLSAIGRLFVSANVGNECRHC